MSRSFVGALLGCVLAVLAARPSPALAHGREPSLGQIVFDPNDPTHVVIRTTWGFLTTRDGGATWNWQCAVAVPFDRLVDDPQTTMMPSGVLLSGTFNGLARSDASECAWEAAGVVDMPGYVTSVVRDPSQDTAAWAIVSPGRTPDVVWRSVDEGATWSVVSVPHPRALTDRIVVAPSDPTRIYTSGVIPRETAESHPIGVLLRSEDRGATFTPLELPLVILSDESGSNEEDERTLHLLGVDPTNEDRLFARVVRRVTAEMPERLVRSDDGGDTWETIHEGLELVGFAMSDDGRSLWVGSWDGGLWRSTDGGDSFEPLDESLRVRCLAWRAPDELWVCADGFATAALSISRDGGETLEELWDFEDSTPDVGCPAGTPVGDLCPMFWPDQIADLQLGGFPSDGGVGLDGSVGPDPGDGGCCSAAGVRTHSGRGATMAGCGVVILAIAASRRGRLRRFRAD